MADPPSLQAPSQAEGRLSQARGGGGSPAALSGTSEQSGDQLALLEWYGQNKRDLPWRRDSDPYRVLVSEIMLQQTQADRVVGYFERFMTQFPSFAALAAAPRAEVIQIWGGLGYNRRAVYLHQLAQEVEARHGGQLPRNADQLRELPGI